MRSHSLMLDHPVGDPLAGVRPGGRVYQDPVTAAVVGGGAILGGAIIQGQAAEDAEDAQYAAGQRSDAYQRETRDQIRADNRPFLETGYQANDLLRALMSSGALTQSPTFAQYQQDPAYGFMQKEAAKAVQGSAAARGGLYSGATMKALADRSQNLANADFGNWWNRQAQGTSNKVNLLNAIRSGGQTAAGAMGAASSNAANVMGSNALQMGNAKAAETMGQGNLFANTLNRFSSYVGGF